MNSRLNSTVRHPDLRAILDQELRQLETVTGIFPADDREAYAWWLSQTFYFVCHSTRLLALAASRFEVSSEDLHRRFLDHTREERAHDTMALRDLKNLGYEIEAFPELPETQAFYQTQYYWIQHRDPRAFFGYILCLEAFAIGGAKRIYEAARDAFGDKSTVFLKVHVQEDVGHSDLALKQLENLTLEQKQMIVENLRLSCHLYAQIYRRINSMAGVKTPVRKAA
jgi:hypothetical protein